MENWKRALTESFLLGSALALAIIFIARQQMLAVLEWISPVFYLPAQGAALLSGNTHEPPPWLFHAVLFLQCLILVFVLGWLAGRYRGQPAKA